MEAQLTPRSPALEAAFQASEGAVRIQNYRVACVLAMIFMPAGCALDYLVYPEHAAGFLRLRLVSSVLLLVMLWLVRTGFGRRIYRWLGIALPAIPSFFISWMIFQTDGAASTYYAGLNLVLLGAALILRWSFWDSLIVVFEVVLLYAAACMLHEASHGAATPFDARMFFNNGYFLTVTGVFAVIGSLFYNKIRFREFALRFEIEENRQIIEENNRRLIELDQAKSRFFAAISHELRTPLTLMLSPLDTLRARYGRALEAGGAELLDTMKANGLRLLRLINDLLDLVRLEEGRAKVEPTTVRVPDFVRGIISSVQHTAQARGISLVALLDNAPAVAMADRDKLERILLNLVFNALKFTNPGGGVTVEVKQGDGVVEFEVRDTGIGIATEDQKHLFRRFWQADSSSSRKQQGAGIGLALVKELTELQGGTVSVKSELGSGTTFTVTLPLVLPEAGEDEESEAPAVIEPSSQSGPVPAEEENWLQDLYRQAQLSPGAAPSESQVGGHVTSGSVSPEHWVLVADDEPDMLRFISRELAQEHRVLTATNGRAAAQLAIAHTPSLIVLDMMMPEMDGITTCRALRLEAQTAHIPIIMLTARADEETKLTALEAGANDFLAKPFSVTELKVRVRNLIETWKNRDELARQNEALESAMDQLREVELQLIQSEKLASLGELSAGMSHEVKNPLNYSLTGLYALKQHAAGLPESDREDYEGLVKSVEDGLRRVLDTVNALRELVHPQVGTKQPVNVREATETALRLLSGEIKDRIETELRVDPALSIHANKSMLLLVLMNLIKNAVDALNGRINSGTPPRIEVAAQVNGEQIHIRVRDNGPGIAPEHQPHVYDILGMGDHPAEMADDEQGAAGRVLRHFFTTKAPGVGMGMGLGICRRIVRAHGGRITFRSQPGEGCEFVVELPACEALEVAA